LRSENPNYGKVRVTSQVVSHKINGFYKEKNGLLEKKGGSIPWKLDNYDRKIET